MSSRRCDYDHEPAWQRIAERGGVGWDDLSDDGSATESYASFERFVASSTFADLVASARGRRPRSLEVGCGGGQLPIRLARLGFEAWGIDFAETAIALARRNAEAAGVEATFLRGDCLAMGGVPELRGQRFDLAVDNHFLHCVVEPDARDRVVRDLFERCRPGALVFCETMTSDLPLDHVRFRVDPSTGIDHHRTRYLAPAAELVDLWTGAGFELSSQRTTQLREGEPADWSAILRRPT